jgi:hypothetical protein
MTDDLREHGPRDRNRVNVNEEWELRYWTKALRVDPDRLKAAVKAVGTSTDAVKAYVGYR